MMYALILADILMVASFLLRFTSLPPQLPLLYSQPWGEEQLVDFYVIFALPLILHIFFFFNIFLYNRLFFPDHFIRRIIFITNISLVVVFTGIFLKIIFFIT